MQIHNDNINQHDDGNDESVETSLESIFTSKTNLIRRINHKKIMTCSLVSFTFRSVKKDSTKSRAVTTPTDTIKSGTNDNVNTTET